MMLPCEYDNVFYFVRINLSSLLLVSSSEEKNGGPENSHDDLDVKLISFTKNH